MKVEREVNAVELRPEHVGHVVEFETVATPEMRDAGLGVLGSRVTIHGELVTVANGDTYGRAWSKVAVMAEVIRGTTARRIRVVSVLGSHRTVTFTGEDGFRRGTPVILTEAAVQSGGLTFPPGVYRTTREGSASGRYGIRFRGATYPMSAPPEA